MKRKTNVPELLAPAGSFDALICAVEAGADAVYLGGKQFQARAFSESFDGEQMQKALLYARLHGVKTYVTLNTALFDKELSEALAFAKTLYESGADAVICADLALIDLIHTHLPQLPIHASTQAMAHNTAGVDFLAQRGAERVVLARELPFSEIEKAVNESKAEIEVFLHGALCVSQSGGCLLSSMVGGRSGNRGMCAQPCRLPYNGTYPLSLKDLCLAEHIPTLCESGVASLKIEGRMKSPLYVYHTTAIYRRLLDERRAATKDEIKHLEKVFCRGDGFTDGYFTDRKYISMTGIRSDAQKEGTKDLTFSMPSQRKAEISARAVCLAGEPVSLSLSLGDKTVEVKGDAPMQAQNAPLSKSALCDRLMKMGDTPFSLQKENIEAKVGEGLFLPVGQINALRRDAAEALEKAFLPSPLAPLSPIKEEKRPKRDRARYAAFATKEAYLRASACTGEFDVCFVPAFLYGELKSPPKGVWLPPVTFDRELPALQKILEDAKAKGATHAMIENIGQIEAVKKAGLVPIGGIRLNVTNSQNARVLREAGLAALFVSPELSAPRARDIGEGVLVYGRVPVMALERCVSKEQGGCEMCGKVSLCDRMDAKFPLYPTSGHRSLLFNSLPTYVCDKKKEMEMLSPLHLYLFTDEGEQTIKAVVKAASEGAPLPFATRRLFK